MSTSTSPDDAQGETELSENQTTDSASIMGVEAAPTTSEQDDVEEQHDDIWTPFLQSVSDEFDLVRKEDKEAIQYVLLPEDTFSLLALPSKCIGSLLLALSTLAIQCTIMVMVLLDVVDQEDGDNPFGFPVSVDTPVRVAQLIAILIAVVSQPDVADSSTLLYNWYDEDGLKKVASMEGDISDSEEKEGQEENEGDSSVSEAEQKKISIPGFWWWLTSSCLRLTVGSLGLFVTFILIMRERTTRDVLLNFAAIEFVSNLDNVAFALAQKGYFGPQVRKDTGNTLLDSDQILDAKNPKTLWQNVKLRFVFIIFLAFLAGWSTIVSKQKSGDYQEDYVFVQFGDEFVAALRTFSGIYRRDGKLSYRPKYTEVRSGEAWLGYCKTGGSEGYWALTIEDKPCEWIARSTELSSSYDILESLSVQWFVRIEDDRTVPLQYVLMAPYPFNGLCGALGSFDNEMHKCKCNGGRLGLQCEFQDPCETLVVDVRRQGFLGDRTWSSQFNLFRVAGKVIQVYDRPVYFNDTGAVATDVEKRRFEIVLFTGRRWALFDHISTQNDLNDFLKRFHAFFSDEKSTAFLSGAVDVFSPGDMLSPIQLQWFHANSEPDPLGIQSADLQRPADVVLMCGECNVTSNKCLHNGVCLENRTCECPIGSRGSLCEDPPIRNGRCDPYFNTAEFEFDGGDCCESTCISSSDYACGKNETGYGDTGYPLCEEDGTEWKPIALPVSGSRSGVQSGSSVALSGNGAVLAIGEPAIDTVRLFYKDGSKWTEGPIVEGLPQSRFGSSLVMVDGGISHAVSNPSVRPPVTIAVGGRSRGFLVYDCTVLGCSPIIENTTPAPVGLSRGGRFIAAIQSTEVVVNSRESRGSISERASVAIESDTETYEAESLSAVAMSRSGSSFAVMLDFGILHSSIQRYEWNGSNYDLAGPGTFLLNRAKVLDFVISDDGMVLAMLIVYNAPAIFDPTQPDQKPTRGVEVYEWMLNGNVSGWSMRGSTISGVFASMDLSAESNILALGMAEEGSIRIYKWQSPQYELWGELPGRTNAAVSLSEKGSVLAVGLPSFEFGKGTTMTYGLVSTCGNETAHFRLSLTLDNYPAQTHWELVDSSGVIVNGARYSQEDSFTTIVEETCLAVSDCYRFRIFDSGTFQEAGLSEPGGFSVHWNGTEVGSSRSFNVLEQVEFGRCDSCEKCAPCPSSTVPMTLGVEAKDRDGTRWKIVVEDTNELIVEGGNYSSAGLYISEACLRNDVCFLIEFESRISAFPRYSLLFKGDTVAVGPQWLKEAVRFGRCEQLSISTREELVEAVDTYLAVDFSVRPLSEVASRYGYPIGTWNVTQVEDFSGIFDADRDPFDFDRTDNRVDQFNESLDGWDVSHASSMTGMFRGAVAFNQNLSSWDVSGVELMNGMFDGATAFVGDGLSVWDTSSATNVRRMFRDAVSFDADLGRWNVSGVTIARGMFNGASSFRGAGIVEWDVSQMNDIRGMFSSALSFVVDLCLWGDRLPKESQVTLAFNASGCPEQGDPDLAVTRPGPFCFACS